MQVFTHNKDIFDVTEADTLVLPVDGSAPGLEGNLAREAMKRFGISHLHEMLAPPPYYPLDGEPCWSNIAGLFDTHFEWVCCIDSLSHAEGADHRANLRRTLHMMFVGIAGGGVGRRIACTPCTGGGRVPLIDATYILLSELEREQGSAIEEVHIVELNPERYRNLRGVVR